MFILFRDKILMRRKGTHLGDRKGGGPGWRRDLSVQMGFVSTLKEAQEIAAGGRKRAFFVLLLSVVCSPAAPVSPGRS